VDAFVVLISTITALSWFVEKQDLFRAIVVLLTILGDLIFLIGKV